MGKLEKGKVVDMNNENYVVIPFKFKGNKYPIILDYMIFKVIKKMSRSWYVNDKGYVYTVSMDGETSTDVYLHDVVKQIQSKLNKTDVEDKPIIHINRITFDNRTENLEYDTSNKVYNKNLKKKKRTIKLPKNSGIKSSELPTYLWYIKNSGSHGDRFFISVDDVSWKSTSSQKVSLKYKLEESKKYLRNLQIDRPDIFNNYSMNGDFNETGNDLLREYFIIAKGGGFDDLRMFLMDKNTDKFLMEDIKGLSIFETNLLNKFDPLEGSVNVSSEFSLFKKTHVDKYTKNLPEHCHYQEGSGNGNDFFYIKNHPECKKWCTDKSTNKSTKDKLKELNNKLNLL